MQLHHLNRHPCPFVIVSGFTPSYADVYRQHLGASLERIDTTADPAFQDAHLVFEYRSQGSWEANCLLKPELLLLARRLTNKPLLWLDADATIPDIHALVEAFHKQQAEPFDVAAYAPGIAKSDDHDARVNSSLLSGTMLWMPTPAANELLGAWALEAGQLVAEQRTGLSAYDQEVLYHKLRLRMDRGLRFRNLNPCWVKIADYFPTVTHPLVVHHQASRTKKGASV